MGAFVTLFGVLASVIGIVGLVSPSRLVGTVTYFNGSTRFQLAVGGRLLLGLVFFLAAPVCRMPLVVESLAVISIVAAIVLLVAGQKRLDNLLTWWSNCSPNVVRISAVFSLIVGILIAFSGI